MIFGGPIIDFFGKLLGNIINESLPFFVRILISCIGCIVLAFGMSIVVQSKAGAGPNDLISVVLSDKTKKSFGLCRIGVDFTLLLLGFLLKGTIGLGTILCLLLVGPVAGKFMNLSEKLVKKYI